jgi:patatin-like phospholipase/acyl hydrolase
VESIRQGDMSAPKRILSIDGGGIKGVMPAAFLATLEEVTGKRIVDHFDLIAGTSTGGIIALGLGLGLSATNLLSFYEKKGPGIFSQEPMVGASLVRRALRHLRHKAQNARRLILPKYRPAALHAALEEAFGDQTLGESQTRLVIPAFDRQRCSVHIFKTPHHERLLTDWKQRAVDVALATAAAPTYLPSHRLANGISLLDGGVWANNPVGVAVVEAIGILGWDPRSLHVLSLGCTEAPSAPAEQSGMAGLVRRMADLFLLGQSHGAMGTAKLLMGAADAGQRLFRFQHIARPGEFGLDAVEQIPVLKGIGAAMAREALPRVIASFLNDPREPFVPQYRESGRRV